MTEPTRHDRYRLPVVRRLTGRLRVLPDFIILGAQKAGTTTVYDNLVKHPAVHPCDIKEVHFFDKNWRRGENWYRAHFPLKVSRRKAIEKGEQWITGEGSPYYMFHPMAAERIENLCPRARLIVVLRNPVERAYSHYQHEKRKGREDLPFEDALAAEDQRIGNDAERLKSNQYFQSFAHQHFSYKSRGRYAEQLERWFKVFPREQFLVLESGELNRNFAETFEDVYRFLGISGFELPQPKRSNVGSYDQMSEATRGELRAYFAPHNERLFDLLGQRFEW